MGERLGRRERNTSGGGWPQVRLKANPEHNGNLEIFPGHSQRLRANPKGAIEFLLLSRRSLRAGDLTEKGGEPTKKGGLSEPISHAQKASQSHAPKEGISISEQAAWSQKNKGTAGLTRRNPRRKPANIYLFKRRLVGGTARKKKKTNRRETACRGRKKSQPD